MREKGKGKREKITDWGNEMGFVWGDEVVK